MVTFNAFVFDEFLFDRVQPTPPRALNYISSIICIYYRKSTFLFYDIDPRMTFNLTIMKKYFAFKAVYIYFLLASILFSRIIPINDNSVCESAFKLIQQLMKNNIFGALHDQSI